jgi:hypothetical protein
VVNFLNPRNACSISAAANASIRRFCVPSTRPASCFRRQARKQRASPMRPVPHQVILPPTDLISYISHAINILHCSALGGITTYRTPFPLPQILTMFLSCHAMWYHHLPNTNLSNSYILINTSRICARLHHHLLNINIQIPMS